MADGPAPGGAGAGGAGGGFDGLPGETMSQIMKNAIEAEAGNIIEISIDRKAELRKTGSNMPWRTTRRWYVHWTYTLREANPSPLAQVNQRCGKSISGSAPILCSSIGNRQSALMQTSTPYSSIANHCSTCSITFWCGELYGKYHWLI